MDNNKDAIRLKSVKRVDPHVQTIVDCAMRTALYNYEDDGESWTKPEVEGTLILYTREAPPHNMLLIINKMSKANFVEPLTPNCEIQVKPPYLLFRSSKGAIYGIWFSEPDDVLRISNAIGEKMQAEATPTLQNSPAVSYDHTVAQKRVSPKGDIMSMLSHAHGVFESKRQEPTCIVNTVTSTSNDLVKPSPLRAGSEPNTVADFFAKVSKGTTGSTIPTSSGAVPSNSTTNPVLQRLFQDAAAKGGQTSVSGGSGVSAPITIPGAQTPHTPQPQTSAPMSLQELEGKLKENLHISSVKDDHHGKSPSSSLLSPQVFTSSQLIEGQLDTSILNQPNLLTPVSCLGLEKQPMNGSQEYLQEPLLPTVQTNISPLTQEQLVQAFTTLLKKDEFVHQLHEAYVQALNRSLKGCIQSGRPNF